MSSHARLLCEAAVSPVCCRSRLYVPLLIATRCIRGCTTSTICEGCYHMVRQPEDARTRCVSRLTLCQSCASRRSTIYLNNLLKWQYVRVPLLRIALGICEEAVAFSLEGDNIKSGAQVIRHFLVQAGTFCHPSCPEVSNLAHIAS